MTVLKIHLWRAFRRQTYRTTTTVLTVPKGTPLQRLAGRSKRATPRFGLRPPKSVRGRMDLAEITAAIADPCFFGLGYEVDPGSDFAYVSYDDLSTTRDVRQALFAPVPRTIPECDALAERLWGLRARYTEYAAQAKNVLGAKHCREAKRITELLDDKYDRVQRACYDPSRPAMQRHLLRTLPALLQAPPEPDE